MRKRRGSLALRTDTIAGLSDQAICDGFQSLREADYKELAQAGHKLLDELRAEERNGSSDENPPNLEANYKKEWRRLKRRYEEVRRIDFFEALGCEETETLVDTVDRLLHAPPRHPAAKMLLADLKGRTWVTRSGIMVDRIASAWLIRRFIDPAAQFIFVDPEEYTHKDVEIRFDMFDGELTHEGDLCTFEVLLAKSGNNDPALQAVAEVVHDIDLKDGKYQRPASPLLSKELPFGMLMTCAGLERARPFLNLSMPASAPSIFRRLEDPNALKEASTRSHG